MGLHSHSADVSVENCFFSRSNNLYCAVLEERSAAYCSPQQTDSGPLLTNVVLVLLLDHFLFFSCQFDRRPLQSVLFIPPQIVPGAAAWACAAILCRPSPGGASGIELNRVFSVFGASAWAQKRPLICDQRGD